MPSSQTYSPLLSTSSKTNIIDGLKINKNLKIAVINGGNSAEAEVSRSSARGVVKALKASYDTVESIELNTLITQTLAAFSPDVVVPILHGPPGEDGTLQGFLEILGHTYVGSGVRASAAAMDKVLAKQVFREANLPLAKQIVVSGQSSAAETVAQIVSQLGTYVVVKPATQGSALGVTLVDNESELYGAIELASELDDHLLVEERIDGREITVGIIDTDHGPEAFPVIEITTPEDSWYDYEHRYSEGYSQHIVPAALTPTQTSRLQQIAIDAHVGLGCRDLSRADFVVANDKEEYLLEVNTLPGMTPTSLYPDGAAAYGMSFEELVSYLVERAANR
ncbi:MAG TPA: D-alanine--D-alanine ligase [Pseudomonadales bacterium]|jgi:D-alanine-D-alanine ligase|nr:D-alanine--D-alanine ligase [Pseudomonadales bacterium]MDP6317102.1 D-alanine--D-alanine ligase [Pseudomonadales bacterium]MDP7316145.1 D-alanine--D-alanine ligase [Pseudomonadales bacterium]HJL60594.1 D-alanine--D-alanine ligase [Pseudomonadales bacterium]HJP50834.1 D-alanine--D-alanine ligase [Pseudomonadales bacterium]|tara:strand:- start:1402 stop:2412 length:1011 start_codon:yes stop_codon:yes gene_type:complete